jgi:hypothetical protein
MLVNNPFARGKARLINLKLHSNMATKQGAPSIKKSCAQKPAITPEPVCSGVWKSYGTAA